MRNIESTKYRKPLPLAEVPPVSSDFKDTISNVYISAHHLVMDIGREDVIAKSRVSEKIEISPNTCMYYRLTELQGDTMEGIGLERINPQSHSKSRIVMRLYNDKIIDWEGNVLKESPRGCLFLNDVVGIVGGIYTNINPNSLDEYSEFTS